jgi:hypothetical protein
MLKIGWLSLLGLLLFLMLLNLAAYQLLPRLRFKHIVIHHTASSEENYQSIKDYHAKRHGWQDAAYHLILSNGSTRVPLGHLEATGRYRSLSYSLATRSRYYNLTGLHLCVVGNYSETSMPAELRGPLAHALAVLQQRFHISDGQILFHRDCNDTQCPGQKRPAVRKEFQDLGRVGVGGYILVRVTQIPAQEHVAHIPPGHIGLIPALLQAPYYLQCG